VNCVAAAKVEPRLQSAEHAAGCARSVNCMRLLDSPSLRRDTSAAGTRIAVAPWLPSNARSPRTSAMPLPRAPVPGEPRRTAVGSTARTVET
jgi:hypothetical protein